MNELAIAAIRSWMRLDMALENFAKHLKRNFGVTGLQLALLRIIAEQSPQSLLALRKRLVLHPATIGQSVEALAKAGFCTVQPDQNDRRARVVAITEQGKTLISQAPFAGPVRLRTMDVPVEKLRALKNAFDEAVELFGVGAWVETGSPSNSPPPKRTKDEPGAAR